MENNMDNMEELNFEANLDSAAELTAEETLEGVAEMLAEESQADAAEGNAEPSEDLGAKDGAGKKARNHADKNVDKRIHKNALRKKVLFFATVGLLVVAFAVSAFMVGDYVMEGKRQEELYAQYTRPTDTTSPTAAPATTEPTVLATEETVPEETTVPTEPTMLEDLAQYYNDNPDTVGYIEIPGTQLSYPVLQTPNDRDYYLDRDFSGKPSQYGAIYTELADINEPSDNITFYGHNMKNGTMFGDLDKYQKKEYWEENQIIFFDTLYERHTYKIFAVFKTSANIGEGWDYHKFIDAQTEEEFDYFVKTAKEGRTEGGKVVSFYDTGITPVYGDKLITLSTCEYTMGSNGRLVVCAVRWT